MFEILQPVWLILLLPLAVAWFSWKLPSRGLRSLRAVIFVLVVLAMSRLAIRLPDRAGTVIVVADRSESMPANAATSENEIITLLHRSMGPRDQLGVVAFGRQAVVEQSPRQGEFAGFTAEVDPGHSDLEDALETALSLIPPDGGGRLLVVSDGKWTGKDPATAAARAAGRGVPVDYRLVSRPQVNDVAIQSFLAPQSVQPGQAYVLSSWIQSPADQEVQYELRAGSSVIASGSKQVGAGLTRLMFRDRAARAGVTEYTLAITGPKDDPVPENNTARALVAVEGPRPILVVSAAGADSGLAHLLQNGGVEVVGRAPQQCQWSLAELSQFAAVVIENVSANQIGTAGMETLAPWVEDAGNGLMLTGGQKSYGPGGYYKSPLDRILPVSMEMRREHRKLSIAIAIAMDRSGSMSMPAGGGRIKMDLADLGAVSVMDLLSDMDEIGVIAVDTAPHVIVPLDTVEKNRSERSKILSIGSMGGGIYVHEALVAAGSMVLGARAQTRHIILFADAADSRQHPGDYQRLAEESLKAGITVSVVGMGTDHDPDADILLDCAQRGGGTCYFASTPDDIPRLFAQDTFTVARSTFIDQATPFEITAGYSLVGGPPSGTPPPVGGYNLNYLKAEANLAAATADDFKAPLVASWNVGNGRVLCFAGECDGKYSGALATWNQAGDFYATMARWAAGKHQPLPADQLVVQQVRDGVCFVQLHLDPERKGDPFTGLPRIKALLSVTGQPPRTQTIPLQWKDADLLEAVIPLSGQETLLNTVEIPGEQPVTLAPVCLPYSPEFAPEQPGRGAAALSQIALTSGGKDRVEIPQTWADLQVKPRYVEMAPWLLVLGVMLFLIEVFERRTGWFSRLLQRRVLPAPVLAPAEEKPAEAAPVTVAVRQRLFKRQTRDSAAAKPVPAPSAAIASTAAATPAAPIPRSSSSTPQPPPPTGADSNLDALRKARDRASKRTGR
jgi:Mg-chelatase subunit ChlD